MPSLATAEDVASFVLPQPQERVTSGRSRERHSDFHRFATALRDLGSLVLGHIVQIHGWPNQVPKVLTEEVLSSVDLALDEPRYHALRDVVMGYYAPTVRLSQRQQLSQQDAALSYLLGLFGSEHEAQFSKGHSLVIQVSAKVVERRKYLVEHPEERRVPHESCVFTGDHLLAYTADRALPIEVREALLASDRLDALSAVVLTFPSSLGHTSLARAILDAWVESARVQLTFLTGLPGVTRSPDVEPMNVNAVYNAHETIMKNRPRPRSLIAS